MNKKNKHKNEWSFSEHEKEIKNPNRQIKQKEITKIKRKCKTNSFFSFLTQISFDNITTQQ